MSSDLDYLMDDCSWYVDVDGATSVPPARFPPGINTTNLDFGMRACIVYPNWFMSSCCEPGVWKRTADGTLADHCGWDVCVSTLSDAQLIKCFKEMAGEGEDGEGDSDQGDSDQGDSDQGDHGQHSEDSEAEKWTGDDGSWKPDHCDCTPNGNGEGGYDDGMWHGKRAKGRHLVRRQAFEFSCAKPSGATAKFAQRSVLGTAMVLAAIAILTASL